MFSTLRWRFVFSVAGLLMGLLVWLQFAAPSPLLTFIVLTTAAGLTWLIAGRLVHPLYALTNVVRRIAAGDLSARAKPGGGDEISQLAQAMNQLAGQIQEQIDNLTGERNRLVTMLDYMADGVLIADEVGRVHLINAAALRLFNTSEATALGRSFAEVARHHQLIELWQRCRATGEEQVAAVEVDRQRLFLQAIVTPFPERRGRGYLIVLQDLTQIHHLQTVRRDFISNVSHELRTPLAALRALVETLQDGALDDPPAAQRFLERMETEVDSLTQIVQELLELSRIESGLVPLRLAPCQVAELVQPAVERMAPLAERADLQLDVELPADLPLALADAERIQQVVRNLTHNAIKFTPPGGRITIRASLADTEEPPADDRRGAVNNLPPATRTTHPIARIGQVQSGGRRPSAASQPSARLVIEVTDTGVGIAAEDLPRIFERFYKADRARSGGGTGLGLAIAKHIVQAHGGQIWVRSREDKGSIFSFSLPIAIQSPSPYP
ncbi:MAG: ATP-binding protein [Chloroflexota bacterium]